MKYAEENSSSFNFWQQWLFYTSILFALFGIIFAVYGDNFFFQPYTTALSKIFLDAEQFSEESNNLRAFLYGPLGGTIACCYLLLAYIAYYPFRKKEKWAWNAVVVAFGCWIFLDSAVCIYYHVYFQVWSINLFSAIVKGLPLMFTYKYFK